MEESGQKRPHDTKASEEGPAEKKIKVNGHSAEESTAPSSPPSEQETKRKRKKLRLIYGNYRTYYSGYRVENVSEDPRLQMIKYEWVAKKACLDIGCNNGAITIEIARKGVRSMVGVDIDPELIREADRRVFDLIPKRHRDKAHEEEPKFPFNIRFIAGNFLELELKRRYDVIICLSVTKWIHLNWGDEGIRRCFQRCHALLNEGGLLILEPQPWASYKKKAYLSSQIKENYKSITLRPEKFPEYLRSIGFVLEHEMDIDTGREGFQRKMYVYKKV